jgi:large subunit ribosomal protein L6
MSRVGQRPIKIEDGVTIEAGKEKITVAFGENKLEQNIPENLSVEVSDDQVKVIRKSQDKNTRALHGLYARLIKNMITGVKENFSKTLEFNGTGYRVAVNGNELVLNMGYSHDINIKIPEDLQVLVVKNTIKISGIKKESVGNFAATVREVRRPEVYKGKGIKYRGEFIKRKAGKTAASK